jgi:hypothetical protein
MADRVEPFHEDGSQSGMTTASICDTVRFQHSSRNRVRTMNYHSVIPLFQAVPSLDPFPATYKYFVCGQLTILE